MRVTGRGAELAKPLAPDVDRLVRRELTVAPLCLNDAFPKKFKVFLDFSDKIVVPLHWAYQALRPLGAQFVDSRQPGDDAPRLRFRGELREALGQPEAVRAVDETWRTRDGGAMLCLPVGYGKTTCALYLAAKVQKKTLVLVHKTFLRDQWMERVAQCLPEATVTCIQGDAFDVTGDVVVATIQTLVSRSYPARTFESFGLLVVDESHHIAAQAFSQSMWGLCRPRVLALSATPDRKDGLARVVTWFAGPIAYRSRRENQACTLVRTVKYSCPEFREPPPTNRRGDVCFTSVVTRLATNPQRTRALAREVRRLHDEGRDVLVLTHRRQHAADLADAVRELCGPDSAGAYVGGDKRAPDTKVIVATYALTSEGFDLPRLNALVLATPASDVEQSCGRVMRGTSGDAVIVDWADQWGVCFAQHVKRRAFYRRSGFTFENSNETNETAETNATDATDVTDGKKLEFLDSDDE